MVEVLRRRRMCLRAATAASLLLALCPASARAQRTDEPAQIGVLTAVNGNWIRGSSPGALGSGTRVFRSDTFRVRSAYTPYKYVTILYTDGRRVRFSCPRQGTCPPVVPSDSLSNSSLLARAGRLTERVRSGVVELFARDARRYSQGITRSGGVVVREAVLALEADGIDLTFAISFLPPGRYAATLRRIPDAFGTVDTAAVTVLEWQAQEAGAAVPAPALAEGLYVLQIRSVESVEAASGWVLVLRKGDAFDHASEEFAAALDLSRTWTAAGEDETRAFLRAVLDLLHRESRQTSQLESSG